MDSLLQNVNRQLHDLLLSYKNIISTYYADKSWDKFKKLSNEYEFIYSSPACDHNVCKYIPTSRSFFKMWEIVHDFPDILPKNKILKCFYLCEGPGGFVEAVIKYRGNLDDNHYGMTLKCDANKAVPDWKFMNKINVTYGVDNTGNIYNINNIRYLPKIVGGKNVVDFITADGGFDFSSDFNNQEDMCCKLIACEILAALHLQKPGGSFVLKVFDIFSNKTISLIQTLYDVYEDIQIVKPLTSRPANSEKYIICCGFTHNMKILDKHMTHLEEFINNGDNGRDIKNTVLDKIVSYNTFLTTRQIQYIQKTFDYIKKAESLDMPRILRENVSKCHKWCEKYEMV